MRSLSLLFASLVLTASVNLIGADAPATFKAGEFTFQRPADWQWIESNSSMRKAQLKITDPQGKEPAEVVFYHFGQGGGGGTQANIDRWLGQFQEPKEKIQSKIEETTAGKHKVTFVQAQGTYMNGMPGGPKTPQPNSMLMAAILESDEGNVFVRLTGPIKLVQASQATFRKMITSSSVTP